MWFGKYPSRGLGFIKHTQTCLLLNLECIGSENYLVNVNI
jgi:hypothetical protein